MATNIKIIIALLVIVLIAIFAFSHKKGINNPLSQTENPSSENASSIEGCYVAHVGKDVYTLNIQSEQDGQVEGFLAYKNFEKDSSVGTLKGLYANGLLIADYSFTSEGMDSVRQVIFKKSGNSFIQGFGPVKVVGTRETLVDPSAVSYDSGTTFTLSAECENFDYSQK